MNSTTITTNKTFWRWVIIIFLLIVVAVTVFVFFTSSKSGGTTNSSGGTTNSSGGTTNSSGGTTNSSGGTAPTPSNTQSHNCLLPSLKSGQTITQDWLTKNLGPGFKLGPEGGICTKNSKGILICNKQVCPFGYEWDDKKNECVEITDKGVGHAHNIVDGCKKISRGICMDKDAFPVIKPWSGLENNRKITINGKEYGVPKLALYHGGLVGDAADGQQCGIYKQYLGDIIKFVKDKKIDVVLAIMNSWTISQDQGKYGFAAYCKPSFLAENFLNKLPDTVEAGLVPYIRPKDSGWMWNRELPGGIIDVTKTFNTFDSKDCPLNPGSEPCPINVQDDCTASCSACPDCNPECLDNNTKCSKICFKKCSASCPNIASQLMNYVSAVNKEVQSSSPKLTYIVFDGEDAGPYNSSMGFCQLKNANINQSTGITHIGFAKALNSGIVPGNVNNVVMPETYWYMNELWPCAGNQYQLGNKPDVCGIQSSYRFFKNKPQAFLNFLEVSSRSSCFAKSGKPPTNNLASMEKNIKAHPGNIWPMFSLENLSMNGSAPNCLANNYSGRGTTPKHQVCGTFDGFSYWDWDKFLEFVTLFAHKYKVKQIGIYESQFLPPSWIDNGYTNDCTPKASSCPISTQSINCSSDGDCTTKLKANEECQNYYGWCKPNGTCQFKNSGGSTSTPSCNSTPPSCDITYGGNGNCKATIAQKKPSSVF